MSTPPPAKRKASASPKEKRRDVPKVTFSRPADEGSSLTHGSQTSIQIGQSPPGHETSLDTTKDPIRAEIPADYVTSENIPSELSQTSGLSSESEAEYVSFNLLYPISIQYQVHISDFDDKIKIAPYSNYFNPNAEDSYINIKKEAATYVEEKLEDPVMTTLRLRHGYCTTHGNAGFGGRRSIRTESEWTATCKLLTECLEKGDRCCLNIHLEYCALYSDPTNYGLFTTIKQYELRRLRKTNVDGKLYISTADLEHFTAPAMVEAIIRASDSIDPKEVHEFIQAINSGARKLFAACLLAKFSLKCLKRLTDAGINDNKWQTSAASRNHCCTVHRKWPEQEVIEKYLSEFLVARFEKDGPSQQLGQNVIVPIIPGETEQHDPGQEEYTRSSNDPIRTPTTPESTVLTGGGQTLKSRALIGEGAHGRVYRVRVDPDHHNLSINLDAEFALKEFKDDLRTRGTGFGKELEMLESLQRFDYPHLTTHLATWTQGDTYCMLFPLARCNLSKYMRIHKLSQSQDDCIWMLEQFRGLSDALRFIYDLTMPGEEELASTKLQVPKERKAGWHHDIKPANILFFDDQRNKRGILQIADFGSSKVNIIRSRSHTTASKGGTLTYEPPEIVAGGTSRPYDVWSLGCVFLETLTWAVFDYRSVKAFRDNRQGKRLPHDVREDDGFWERNTEGVFTRRDSVNQCISKLHETISQRGLPLSEILDLIDRMLDVNKNTRILAPEVARQAGNILGQKKADLRQPNPISRRGSEASEASSIISLLPQRPGSSSSHRGSDALSIHNLNWSGLGSIDKTTFLTASPTTADPGRAVQASEPTLKGN